VIKRIGASMVRIAILRMFRQAVLSIAKFVKKSLHVRIQKNGANMNQNVVTMMLWRVAQNYAAFVKKKLRFSNSQTLSHVRI
jgi:hypothetical protein